MATSAKGGSGRGRMRAPHLGPERRRPLVLDAAFRVFLERGYEGASMEAIAEAAGVTKPVVYDCYPSKEELFAELLRREEERVLAEVAAALPRHLDLDDPEPTLARGFVAFLRAVALSPDAYRVIFLGEGGANIAVARRVRRGREQQVEAIALRARRRLSGRRAGADAEHVALLVGQTVVALAEAGARALLADPEAWTPESLGALLARLAVRGQASL
jgi:AcrR family transcriptional regulator